MSIQIIITGDHSTDVLAELKTFSAALTPDECPFDVDEGMNRSKELFKKGMEEAERSEIIATGEVGQVLNKEGTGWEDPKPTKLSGPQHKIEADKMIDAGEIDDDIFPLLSQRQKDRVLEAMKTEEDLDALEKGEFEVVSEPEQPIDQNFNDVEVTNVEEDEPTTEDKLIDTESLKALMSTVCRDENGKDIPEKYSATRNILRSAVPEGKDIKISNIPAEKLKEVYYSIAAL